MQSRLLGIWELTRYSITKTDAPTQVVSGARGCLIYSLEGWVSVLITTPEHRLSYFGRFEISGDQVSHHVEISNQSRFRNSIQRRSVRFESEELILSTLDRMDGVHEVRWIPARP